MGLLLSMFMRTLFGNKKAKIAMLGLDAAGKTTLLYKLKLDENIVTIPTVGFNVEEITFHNVTMTVWDVGGQKIIRQLWHYYLENCDAVIWVLDSCDYERFNEVKDELNDLIKDDRLRNAAFLILANKQDLPNPAQPHQIIDKLGLHSVKSHEWYIQPCCAVTGDGLPDALSWLATTVNNRK